MVILTKEYSNMKNILSAISLFLLLALVATGCDPKDTRDESLGPIPTAEQLDFTITPTDNPNIVEFVNTSKVAGIASWDFGNNSNGKGEKAKGSYPFAGTYSVKLTLNTRGGMAELTKEVTIAEDNPSMLTTEVYINLTGGAENPEGKTWVIDQWNNFTDEVAKEFGSVGGHMGLGPIGSYGQEWWAADANAKADWTLYAHTFNFQQDGLKLNIKNQGTGYGRGASAASVGGFDIISVEGEDVTFTYDGGDFTFSILESEGNYPVITLPHGAFLGYYCGTQQYDVIYQTEEVMALRMANTTEEQDWVLVYCLEELNVEPTEPEPTKELKAPVLNEDFEGEKLSVAFEADQMGDLTSFAYGNPSQWGLNTSKTVTRYHKESFYANVTFEADYKFDISENHIITIDVYIPGENDFTTEHEVAGEWIAVKNLTPQLAIKLQDMDMGGNAWQNQAQIVKEDLELNKWLRLEFDFSEFADRVDFDKIVIQFGGEGHAAPGLFYFDNFKMNK